jgi:benzoate membrane transport protein
MPRVNMASESPQPEVSSTATVAPSAATIALGILTAGMVTVLVGFSSSYPIVVQAGAAMGLTASQLATMTAALSLGMGLTCLLPSIWLKIPVVIAWSTPGAALLVVSLQGVPLPQAIGAFIVCGLLLTIAGASGLFERWMSRIPLSLASALLAGVLLRFGIEAFSSLRTAAQIVGPMLVAYLLARRSAPRLSVPITLAVGLMAFWILPGAAPAAEIARLGDTGASLQPLAWPPQFSVPVLLGITVPLFLVTMASQNLPGVAVLRAAGYERAPVSRLLTIVGLATLLLAPFGVFALNLAAITAALCMGPEAHPDPARRWLAAAMAGVFYLTVAVFAGPIAAWFVSLPRELVVAIAGVALLPTIGRSMHAALLDESQRDPALVTLLTTASGLTLAGIGSAFWGVVFGVLTMIVWRPRSA